MHEVIMLTLPLVTSPTSQVTREWSEYTTATVRLEWGFISSPSRLVQPREAGHVPEEAAEKQRITPSVQPTRM